MACLTAGTVVLARQQARPAPQPDPIEDIRPLPGPFEAPPGGRDAEATADSFLETNQQLAARRLAELTERCERL
jgi:hypothetical protein